MGKISNLEGRQIAKCTLRPFRVDVYTVRVPFCSRSIFNTRRVSFSSVVKDRKKKKKVRKIKKGRSESVRRVTKVFISRRRRHPARKDIHWNILTEFCRVRD